MKTDSPAFNRFFHGMLDRGVYFAPALYEAGFVSAAHTRRRHRRHGGCGSPVFRGPLNADRIVQVLL